MKQGKIEKARPEDIENLLRLYQLVYGKTYPFAFGTDPDAALELIQSNHDLWLVERDSASGRPIGSVIFDVDASLKIGKVTGLVVHPDFNGKGIATHIVEAGTKYLLSEQSNVNSIYTTTRTNSIGPQLVFLRNEYLPLGIFPNAHKLREYETLTLFARHRPDALQRRVSLEAVPAEVSGLIGVLRDRCGIDTRCDFMPSPSGLDTRAPNLDFELIHAPEFVKRRFNAVTNDDYDRFYPFHQPNLLMISTNGEVEIYAFFSPQDHYCAIVSLNVPIYELAGRMGGLLDQLKEAGVSYIELLLGLQHGKSIDAASEAGFIPSAIYPAMRENADGKMEDFVVLSRTLEPLNFRGMSIAKEFKPYVDQYVNLWKKRALESLRIIQVEEV